MITNEITSGMFVEKYGATTKLQSGTVLSGTCAVLCDGTTYTDQVKLNIKQEGGDSGAPVVHDFIGPIPDGQKLPITLLGIATIADMTTWQTAWVSEASNINSIFGLSTYIMV